MATTTAALEAFSKVTGHPVWALDRFARDLRNTPDDLWPRSGKGGRSAARHVEASHLANFILALSAPQPGEALPAVRALADLQLASRQKTPPLSRLYALAGIDAGRPAAMNEPIPEEIRGIRLQTMLAGLVHHFAAAKIAGHEDDAETWRLSRWSVAVTPSIPAAWVMWTEPHGADAGWSFSDEYGAAQPHLALASALERPAGKPLTTVSLPFPLLETAAELLADTLRRKSGDLLSGPGSTGAGTPENKEPDPNGDRAPTHGQRPRTEPQTGNGQTNEADDSAQHSLAGHTSGTAGHPPQPKRKAHARSNSPFVAAA